MSVTRILSQIESGDPSAAEKLLPLVYDELRKLATSRLAHEAPGQTLQPTALVHEAYLRLVINEQTRQWDSRGHFFAAAAEGMRRILVDAARRKNAEKRSGNRVQHDVHVVDAAIPETPEDLVALDDALERLATVDKQAAELVHLRFFAGLSLVQAGEMLGISSRSADRLWSYARAWLHQAMQEGERGQK